MTAARLHAAVLAMLAGLACISHQLSAASAEAPATKPGEKYRLALASAAGAAASLAARAARFPAVETATASFTQRREVALVEDTLTATGTIALRAPDTIRLDVESPERVALVTEAGRMLLVDDAGRAQPLPAEHAALGRFARQLLALLVRGEAPGAFEERWDGPDTVTLAGTDRANPYREIRLRFPPDGPLPEEVALRERGGDRTTIRLHGVALNPTLPDAWPHAGAGAGS